MLAIISRIRTSRGRQSLLRLALAGFLLRALVPVGFMPASLDTGGPFQVCHGGLAGAFFEQLAGQTHNVSSHGIHGDMAGHAGHDHRQDAGSAGHADRAPGHDAWDQCPTGATASAAALAPTVDFSLLALSHGQPAEVPFHGIPTLPLPSYQARAPPLTLV